MDKTAFLGTVLYFCLSEKALKGLPGCVASPSPEWLCGFHRTAIIQKELNGLGRRAVQKSRDLQECTRAMTTSHFLSLSSDLQ
jgi:hypothetical protein